MKRVKITKRWVLCPQTPAFHTFMFLRACVYCYRIRLSLKNYEFAFSKCSAFASLGIVSLHTSAGFVGKGPIIFLPLTSGNLATLRVYPPPPPKKIAGIIF